MYSVRTLVAPEIPASSSEKVTPSLRSSERTLSVVNSAVATLSSEINWTAWAVVIREYPPSPPIEKTSIVTAMMASTQNNGARSARLKFIKRGRAARPRRRR